MKCKVCDNVVCEDISSPMAMHACNHRKIQCCVQFEALYTQTASVLIQQSHSLQDGGDSQPKKKNKIYNTYVAPYMRLGVYGPTSSHYLIERLT